MKTRLRVHGADVRPPQRPPHLDTCFRVLLKAHDNARELHCNLREFAVERDALYRAGVPSDTMRWLVIKGYVEHLLDYTRVDSKRRLFRPGHNLGFWERSCFVLSRSGLAYARKFLTTMLRLHRPESDVAQRPTNPDEKTTKPTWNASNRTLLVRGIVAIQFRRAAPNQEAVLARFQELGWPPVIDDPLPPGTTRNRKKRLHDTIKELNRSQENRLIQFYGDGTGRRVGWRLIE